MELKTSPNRITTDPQVKRFSFKKLLNYFREYCNCTSIHGFRYFGEKRTIYEKIWWCIVFIISLMMCMYCIVKIYRKWEMSPVIVSFATRGEPIYNIPFPAVTVCLESKVKPTVFNYTNTLIKHMKGDHLTENEEKIFGDLAYICSERTDLNYSTLANSTTEDFFKILEKVSPEFSLINCKFYGDPVSCNQLFTPIITDEGRCYTFNLLDRNELFSDIVVHYSNFHQIGASAVNWSIDQGYMGNEVVPYPRRALLAGARYALEFDMQTPVDTEDFTCTNSIKGYRILFHAPFRLPRLSLDYQRLPFNRAFTASIKPTQITTSDAVKNYPAAKRKCYFGSEKKLKYFSTYSQTNCKTECLTNVTLQHCKCVIFFMPRENGTRICSGADFDCALKIEHALQVITLYKKIDPKKVEKYNFTTCTCLPLCTDISYTIGISQTNWDWSKQISRGLNDITNNTNITNCSVNITNCPLNTTSKKYVITNNTNLTNCSGNITGCSLNTTSKKYYVSRVTAYFTSGSFIGSERNELYGPTDFLANFGGLLGLFTGFSVLSFMEIIYFLSLRLICNKRLYGHCSGVEN